MFLDALWASMCEDAVFLAGTLLIMIIAIVGTFCLYRKQRFDFYCEFQKVFWALGVVCLVIAVGAWCTAIFWLQAKRVALNTIKSNKAEIREAIQHDYTERMQAAKTPAQRTAIKNEYLDNGYSFSDTGKLIIKDTSRVKQELLDWLNIRDRMEKSGNCSIKLPGLKRPETTRPSLNDKLNEKAVKALLWVRQFRFCVWSGIVVLIGLGMFIAALAISKQGTEEKIREELEY